MFCITITFSENILDDELEIHNSQQSPDLLSKTSMLQKFPSEIKQNQEKMQPKMHRCCKYRVYLHSRMQELLHQKVGHQKM